MPLSRRALVASAILLPIGARAQSSAGTPIVLELAPAKLQLLPVPAEATEVWAINGQVPGPLLRVTKGEEVFVRVVNHLPQPTAIHWQGVRIRNDMDGVVGLTQLPVAPGASFDYRFTPPDAGTYWYRASAWPLAAEQKGRGLYGLLVVDDPQAQPVDRDILLVIDDWRLDGQAALAGPFLDPADVSGEGRSGPLVTVNSVIFPETFKAPAGARVRLRILNACSSRFLGLVFEDMRPFVVGIDGQSCEQFEPVRRTLPAGPGARFDVIFDMPADPELTPRLMLRGGGLRVDAGGEKDRPLALFAQEGGALPARPAISSRLNPVLPPVIHLEAALRLDVTIALTPGADPRKAWSLTAGAKTGNDDGRLFRARRGQPVTIGFINASAIAQTIHIHGHAMRILHQLDDGWEPYWRDNIIIPPGHTVRVAFLADNPGRWLIESTILDHAMSGLAAWFEVT